MDAHIKFAKLREDARIPSKRDEDAGFDIYACFDEDYMLIPAHATKIIPTKIASACDKDYCFIVKERGSTGSKGMAVRMGVIDSGYRDGWMVGITNTNSHDLYISKLDRNDLINNYNIYSCSIVYPYTKAIAQALVVPVPHTTIEEVSYEDLCKIESERGTGALGSSGK